MRVRAYVCVTVRREVSGYTNIKYYIVRPTRTRDFLHENQTYSHIGNSVLIASENTFSPYARVITLDGLGLCVS